MIDSHSAEYKAWWSMIHRCCRVTCGKHFKNYRKRGIRVSRRYFSFKNFMKDVGRKPSSEYSLDRIDNSKGYMPGNLRWATLEQQNRNKRDNVILKFRGQKKCLAEWSKILNISDATLRARLAKKWPIEKVLSKENFRGKRVCFSQEAMNATA
jgi:hypothetical protein